MATLTAEGLSGFLLASGTALERAHFRHFSLTFADTVGATKWERCGFTTNRGIFGEEQVGMTPPFSYPVLCRRSGNRLVLLGSNRGVVDRLLRDASGVAIELRLSKVPIAIDDLVKSIAKEPGRYSVSFMHARLAALDSSLRSLSYYGDAVTESRLFLDHAESFSCHGCGLRDVVYGNEVMRLGTDGAVSCASSAQTRLRQIEAALQFVSQGGFLR